jgi:hypothetical protein
MAYTLVHSTGTLVIGDTELLSRTAVNTQGTPIGIEIDIPGRNYSGYGKYINQNLIDLLENHARYVAAPNRALKGQLWFDTTVEAKAGEGAKGILKYNVGIPGSPEWRELAANNNDVYFNTATIQNIIVQHDIRVLGDIKADGGAITTDQETFDLLNTTAKTVNAFGDTTELNIGGAYNYDIAQVSRANNIVSVVVTEPHLLVPGDVISITCSDSSYDETLVEALVGTADTFIYYSNVGADTNGYVNASGLITHGFTHVYNHLDVQGDLNIDGGNITSSLSKFDIFPRTVQTIDIGKRTAAIDIGDDTGLTTIRHNLQVNLDVNIDGRDLTTTQPVFNLLDTTVKEVNAFSSTRKTNIGSTFQITVTKARRESTDQGIVSTLTTSVAHNLSPGEYIRVAISDGSYNVKYAELLSGTQNNLLVYRNQGDLSINDTTVTGYIVYGVTEVHSILDVEDNVNIDGGNLLTNQYYFNILPENATNINIGASGTLINIGSSSGYTNIVHDLNVHGGDLTTDVESFNLLNTSAKTINFAGETTNLHVGASTGATTINHDLHVVGSLLVNGTTTYVDSTAIRIKDPIIELGGADQVESDGSDAAGDPALASSDGKDRGFALKYFNGTAKTAFMGWDLSQDLFIFSRVSTISSEVVTVSSYADVRADNGYFNSNVYAGFMTDKTNVGVEIGSARTINGDSYVNFISTISASSNAKITRVAGTNSDFNITNNGTGSLNIEQSTEGDVRIKTNGVSRMLVDGTTGKVGINTDSPYFLETINTNATQGVSIGLALNNPIAYSYSNGESGVGIRFTHDDGTIDIGSKGTLADIYAISESPVTKKAGSLVFSTRDSETETTTPRVTINSKGKTVIGTTIESHSVLTINQDITGPNAVGAGITVDGVITSDVTSMAYGFRSKPVLENTAFSLDHLYHYSVNANPVEIGQVSQIQNQYGFAVSNTLTAGTNNYGFYSNINAGSGRYNFYSNGTAENYFKGSTTIDVTSTTAGLTIKQSGSGNALVVQDQSSDSTPTVIDSNGTVIIGYSSDVTGIGKLQVHDSSPKIVLNSWEGFTGSGQGAAYGQGELSFYKSKGDLGAKSPVSDGDRIGYISAYGVDTGNAFSESSRISLTVDGTPSAGAIPGRFSVSTRDSAGKLDARFNVRSSGAVEIGNGTNYLQNANLHIYRPLKSYVQSGGDGYGAILTSSITTDVKGTAFGYASNMGLTISGTNLPRLVNFYAANPSVVQGASLEYFTGFKAAGNPADVSYSFGFLHGSEPSLSSSSSFKKWAFYSSTDEPSSFGGQVSIGTENGVPADESASLTVHGGIRTKAGLPTNGTLSNVGYAFGTSGNIGMFSDGGSLAFYADGVRTTTINNAGIITDSLTTTKIYGPGTLYNDWTVPSTSSISGNVIPRIATQTAVGGIKVGDGLTIASDGKLSLQSLSGFDTFATGQNSPGPTTFPSNSVRGFDAYSSSDFPGNYYSGITVSGPSGVRSAQLAMKWDHSGGLTGSNPDMYMRVNDDTGTTSTWSDWTKVMTGDYYFMASPSQGVVTVSYSDSLNWSNDHNYFDVYPPSGYTIFNLIAFMPGVAKIWYNGDVDHNDALRAVWYYYSPSVGLTQTVDGTSDRVRVIVQNTEQDNKPSGNYMSVWRKT